MLVFTGVVTQLKQHRSRVHNFTCPHTHTCQALMIHPALCLVLQCFICIVGQIKLMSANPAYTHYFLCTALHANL